MLALLAAEVPPDQDQYSFEFKWDGIRAITYWDGRHLRIESRNQNDITRRYPELQDLADALGSRKAVLDGEIVALDENDQPSFPLLTRRMHVEGAAAIERLVHEVPVYYVIFDLLWLDGRSVMNRSLKERREMLEELTLMGPNWRVSPAMIGEGTAMFETARKHRLEGIVAKKLDSTYQPGKRSPHWRKIKTVFGQEFVVGGWTPEEGSTRRIGSLLVGYYEAGDPKKFRYAGSVGTGYKAADHVSLSKQLAELATDSSPFADKLPKRGVNFVKPQLVVEIEYRRWPATGSLQQASYKGVRTDKRASQVVREDPRCM